MTFERGAKAAGVSDRLTGSAERPDDVVISGGRLQVGRHVVAVEELHGVFLQPPHAVVAHDHDDRQPMPDQRVDVHQ